MLQQQKAQGDGFTIIEVMIVLAIAALILLIVLLAVPALERSSRNTQRKNDVSAILQAVVDYSNNNSGVLPATSGVFNTEFANANPSLGYYSTAANVTWKYQANAGVVNDPDSPDKVVIASYTNCVAAPASIGPGGATTQVAGATARSVVALYDVEGSSGLVPQCTLSGS